MDREFALPGSITGAEIRALRAQNGLSRKELARLASVSVKAVERWENSAEKISGPVVFLRFILAEQPGLTERLAVPEQELPLRLLYYHKNDLCTLIDVDEAKQLVRIRNYTDRLQYRAFGPAEHPDFQAYQEFLKSRCFPETRDKLKLELARLNLPFYDPLLIIEKTEGRMAEDLFRIQVLWKGVRND